MSIVNLVNIVNANNMYIIISNLVMGEIDILRDVPEDCGDIEQYLKDKLQYDTNHIQ